MAHPLVWPGKTFFYPIGNTSAVCLIEDLGPEEAANVLLLGCGDPRHILYTAYVSGLDLEPLPRKLDITCCDVEGAVLARNIILFTLLADAEATERLPLIWNIFYHFYLDDDSLALLLAQCRKLIDLASSSESWRSGQYAAFVSMCTEETLSELRRFWTLYVETERFTAAKYSGFKKDFTAGVEKTRDRTKDQRIMTSSRSAGPVSTHAMDVVSEHFARFWRTGISSSSPRDSATSKAPNPTFAYSAAGDKFAVHYGTDPLASFHLAEIFAPIQGAPDGRAQQVTVDDAIAAVKSQFYKWCTATSKLLQQIETSSSIMMRFFVGDALSLCHALRYCQTTNSAVTPIHTAPWKGTSIILDNTDYGSNAKSPAPTAFNVIDTSNVLDHVGLLNILTCVSPILVPSPSSTVYTEALLRAGENAMQGILEHVCGDLSTLSLLIGLVPVSFVSRFTTHSNIHDVLVQKIVGPEASQFHERLAWKSVTSTAFLGANPNHIVSFPPQQLSNVLFGVYLKMFADDDTSHKFKLLQMSKFRVLRDTDIIHYMRHSFAEFLRVVMDRVETDWPKVMETFCEMVRNDRNLLIGMNCYQDLCCHFHMLGVFTVDWLLTQKIREVCNSEKPEIFRGWKSIPQAICVVLVIPRNRIASIESLLDKAGTPTLHCDVKGAGTHNVFSSISAVFGTVRCLGARENKKVVIEEDTARRFGTSALIVSFYMPSPALMVEPQATIGLGVHSTLASSFLFMPILGSGMRIFEAAIGDAQHVHVLSKGPSSTGEHQKLRRKADESEVAPSNLKMKSSPVTITMDNSCANVSTLTARADIADPIAQSLLAGGSAVNVEQASPMRVRLRLDSYKQLVAFPLPVDATRAKLRVARKSKYIEVVAPLLLSNVVSGENTLLGKFPIIFQGRDSTLWNVHRVQLDRLPVLRIKNPANVEPWFVPHVSLMMSDREKRLREQANGTNQVSNDALMNLKDSLHVILISAAGLQGRKPRTAFGLTDPSTVGGYTLIFVSNVRLDLGSHTVVADSWVLPLTHALVEKLSPALGRLTPHLLQVKTDVDEMRAWKQLLPAVTERCRSWRHKDNCDYITKGAIPLSTQYTEDPICGCGRGVGSAALAKDFKDFAPFVTRAALSPLFAVSYLESVGSISATEEGAGRSALADAPLVCAACGKGGKPKLLICAKCRNVRYCSSDCQLKDWKQHKKSCS
ncbi:hypothetical protein BV22DRAFT_1032325 [Leucogyrophana mollusca]|uniref:Uncharacterized protein n=1 Tax=Leucogyrophana mollusca TaxID=85980 RepID=A0ACB8BMM2_9AGAM|nr:hypothetical protein BV22DRAFT_1032325 [Leucogyrophana mollusca]